MFLSSIAHADGPIFPPLGFQDDGADVWRPTLIINADRGLVVQSTDVTMVISVDPVTSGTNADSSTTQSDSGLEFVSNKLTILRGCDDNQILKWDETDDDWNCETDSSGGSTSPGGVTNQIQYNSSDAFSADAGLTYFENTNILTIGDGSDGLGMLVFDNDSGDRGQISWDESVDDFVFSANSGDSEIRIESAILHDGDTDTSFIFNGSEDQINIKAGGIEFLNITESTTDTFYVNKTNEDVDFIIDGDITDSIFRVDGGNENTSVGVNNAIDMTAKFVVSADTTSVADILKVVSHDSNTIFIVDRNNNVRIINNGDLELPQAVPAAPDSDGEIELNLTAGKLVIQNSSAHAALSSSTDIAYASLLKTSCITLIEPDQIFTVSQDVVMINFNTNNFPHGVEISTVYMTLATSVDSTYILLVKNGPTDVAGDIVTTISTTSSNAAVSESPDVDGTVDSGEFLFVSIDAVNTDWSEVCIDFYEPIS